MLPDRKAQRLGNRVADMVDEIYSDDFFPIQVRVLTCPFAKHIAAKTAVTSASSFSLHIVLVQLNSTGQECDVWIGPKSIKLLKVMSFFEVEQEKITLNTLKH